MQGGEGQGTEGSVPIHRGWTIKTKPSKNPTVSQKAPGEEHLEHVPERRERVVGLSLTSCCGLFQTSCLGSEHVVFCTL